MYDAIVSELAKQQIYVHLDNHMSKGAWCCGGNDGNAWFGDTDFNVNNWKRGLQFMADHVCLPLPISCQTHHLLSPSGFPRKANSVAQGKKWPNLVSIGLRNEFRKPDKTGNSLPYNWQTWYEQIKPAADIVNAANPNILIFLSGLDYDTKLTPIPGGDDLGGGKKFRLSDFLYKDKLVLELHNYQTSAKKCSDIEGGLWDNGFRATYPGVANRMPVVLTEFGFTQADKSYNGVYATCLHSLMVKWKTGWMVWAVSGSYYTRGGTQDYEETWGLLNHQWSDWRNKDAITALKGMVDDTLKSVRS